MPHEKNEYYIHKLQLDAADHTTEESIKYWKGHFDYLQNRIAECQNIIASPNQTQEAIDKEKYSPKTHQLRLPRNPKPKNDTMGTLLPKRTKTRQSHRIN